MKKIIFTFWILVFSIGISYAKPIDVKTAQTVAYNFLKNRTNSVMFKGNFTLELEYTYSSAESNANSQQQSLNYFYLFNVVESGFVAVSADDIVEPILAYSDEGKIAFTKINQSTAKWFQGYADQIRFAIVNNLEATEEIKTSWDQLLYGNTQLIRRGSVSPLISTKWDQSPYYNDLCPYDKTYKERTVTGCVATAMAQVLKYWNYPKEGSGFYSYNHGRYGTLSSSFGSHTYDYSKMPNSTNSANSEVAQLMYDCGISVEMDYNVSSQGGSGAYVISSGSRVQNCTEYALKTYFNFPSTLSGKERRGYTDVNWLNMIKADLDAGQPIIYAGYGTGGGHCFVADGYDNNNYIHFNWGWGGSSDGYFQINALNPGSLGSGGGAGGFNSGQQAIFGVKPPATSLNYELTHNTSMTISPTTIDYGSSFSVSANFTNNSNITFNGDYCAAVFDDNDNFIDYIEIKSGYSLQSGYKYTNNLVFSTTGILGMLPGKYWVGVYYRPTGGNWSIIKGTFLYSNYKSMTVTNNNSIALYSDMTTTPINNFTKGSSGSVSVNIINNSASTFTGKYNVSLYNLDGSFAQSLGMLTETNGLPAGYVYKNALTFTADTIKVEPGTYLLATLHIWDGNTNWELTGTGNYQNPIFIDVVAPPLQPDKYEINDNASVAYALSLNFSGNNANVNTIGSNCHTGEDYDFYKINLPAGYNYSLSPRVHDAFNAGNGNSYTLDALFSYSLDNGSTWSDAYDDVMPTAISTAGQKTIIFKVAPFFSGNSGTYLLEIPMTRSSNAGVDKLSDLKLKIYPNPTKETITISNDLGINLTEVIISDMQGRTIYKESVSGNSISASINTKNLAKGFYTISAIDSEKKTYTQKLIKE
jgi:hypothetical protein